MILIRYWLVSLLHSADVMNSDDAQNVTQIENAQNESLIKMTVLPEMEILISDKSMLIKKTCLTFGD